MIFYCISVLEDRLFYRISVLEDSNSIRKHPWSKGSDSSGHYHSNNLILQDIVIL